MGDRAHGAPPEDGTNTNETHLMVTDPGIAFCDAMTDEQDALAHELLERLAAKWPLWILHELAEAGEPLRYSRLAVRVDGISQKVLTQTLRMLERDGLATRTLYPDVPPRVEYAITPLGVELRKQIAPLWRWIVENYPAFEAARAASNGEG